MKFCFHNYIVLIVLAFTDIFFAKKEYKRNPWIWVILLAMFLTIDYVNSDQEIENIPRDILEYQVSPTIYSNAMKYTPNIGRFGLSNGLRVYIQQLVDHHSARSEADLLMAKSNSLLLPSMERRNYVTSIITTISSAFGQVDLRSRVIAAGVAAIGQYFIYVYCEYEDIDYYMKWSLWHMQAAEYYEEVLYYNTFAVEGCPTWTPIWKQGY